MTNVEGDNKKNALISNFSDGTAEVEQKMPPVSIVLGTNEVMEEEGGGWLRLVKILQTN